MRKTLLATLITLMFSGLNAAGNPCWGLPDAPCATNNANAPCATENSCCNPLNLPCSIGIPCFDLFDRLSFNAEFLWWKAKSDNFFTNVTVRDSAGNTDTTVYEKEPYEWGWGPGFRLGLGYEICMCGREIDLFADWTHFRATDSQSISRTASTNQRVTIYGPIIADFYPSFLSTAIGTYVGQTDFLYNRFDMGLAAEAWHCGNFEFVPDISFTYAHIHQKLSQLAVEAENDQSSRSADEVTASSKYSGYGITLGGDVSLYIGKCLTLFGTTGIAGLWGESNLKLDETFTLEDQSVITGTDNFKDSLSHWEGRCIIDLQIGLEYQTFYCCWPISAYIGWEYQYLPGMNLLKQLAAAPEDNQPALDVSINGMFLGLTIGF